MIRLYAVARPAVELDEPSKRGQTSKKWHNLEAIVSSVADLVVKATRGTPASHGTGTGYRRQRTSSTLAHARVGMKVLGATAGCASDSEVRTRGFRIGCIVMIEHFEEADVARSEKFLQDKMSVRGL